MRGQMFSMDMMVALTIFFMILGIIVYLWWVIPDYREYDMQERANMVAEYLTVGKLGEENMLRCSEIAEIREKDYSTLRSELNCKEYDVFVMFNNTSNVCNGNEISFGEEPANTNYTSSIMRIVYLDNQKMHVIVRLYD